MEEHTSRALARQTSDHSYQIERLQKELKGLRADVRSYVIEDAKEVGKCLVLKLHYMHPGGQALDGCTFQGHKIIVFNASMKEALTWREIDPHFREDQDCPSFRAPSPIARFPATDVGWADAIKYAESK